MIQANERATIDYWPERKSVLTDIHSGSKWDSAFHRLFSEYSERVYRWALYLGADSASAEEITQEVFVVVYKKGQWPESDAALSAYLFQVTRRLMANFRRSGWVKRIFKIDTAPMGVPDDSLPEESSEGPAMRQILGQMPLKWVEVLLLHDLDGYTRTEISGILGIAEGTVASRLRFARADFIEKWTEDHHE
ncbi:MAG: RNA polymerase sigma factor [Deltaproteobacteria bacterium]|nr:RNA polymerase sigma factor [Deltaproteobacteria bacterium]